MSAPRIESKIVTDSDEFRARAAPHTHDAGSVAWSFTYDCKEAV